MCDLSIDRCVCETVDIPRSEIRRDSARIAGQWLVAPFRGSSVRDAARWFPVYARGAITGQIR